MALSIVGCVQASPGVGPRSDGAPATEPPQGAAPIEASLLPPDPTEVTAVSLTSTDDALVAQMKDCGVPEWSKQVAGIGLLTHASLAPEYVRLNDGVPELQSDAHVLAVQYLGTIRVGLRGAPGSAAWKDVENLTCIFVDGYSHLYVTGPWVDSTGASGTPNLDSRVTKRLPKPLP